MAERLHLARVIVALLAGAGLAAAQEPEAPEPVTFEQAVQRATARNATVGQAEQAVRRSQALLALARSVFRPVLEATASTTVLDDERGFSGNVTQPRTQSRLAATLSYPLLSAWRWAVAGQAADQVAIARISAQATRRQVAFAAGQAYLAVVAAQHQRDIAVRNRDTARALTDYARARLDAGQGSRLDHVRASQQQATAEGLILSAELAVRSAQEALGVVLFASGPVAVAGDPQLPPPTPPADDESWIRRRPDVARFAAAAQAADRVVADSWKALLPTATVEFSPQYVTPAGFFEPSKTWRAFFELNVPIYDGALGAARRQRIAEREIATLQSDEALLAARSEVRQAREAVARHEQMVVTSRQAAESGAEALRITQTAYQAGATTNVEVVQAQQTARSAELQASVAEDQLRQARLALLVALGQFPP